MTEYQRSIRHKRAGEVSAVDRILADGNTGSVRQRDFERAVLGAPVVPHGRATAVVNAIRRRLSGTHRAAAPPPLRVMEAVFAQFDAYVLKALIDIDLPNVLTEPIAIPDLATRIGADTDRLERLLRFAAARGYVRIDRNERVRPTGTTRALRDDAPAAWAAWIRFATSEPIQKTWLHLGASIEARSAVAFEQANGHEFFEFMTRSDPETGAIFDQAMTAGATLQTIGLARTFDWDEVTSVCDVGGGTGATLDVLQSYHPRLDVTLFDLPEVTARANWSAGFNAVSGRREIVAGSFFESIPTGHDRYLLLAVVHDWDDAQAAAILRNLRSAMKPRSQAIVVESPLSPRPADDLASSTDLMMLALTTGRERTQGQYETLFATAGLRLKEQRILPTTATAFVLGT